MEMEKAYIYCLIISFKETLSFPKGSVRSQRALMLWKNIFSISNILCPFKTVLSLFLSFTQSLSLTYSLSLSLSFPVYLTLPLTLSLSHSLIHHNSRSHSLSLSYSLPLTHSLFPSLSPSLSFPLSYFQSLSLPLSVTLSPTHSHSLTQSLTHYHYLPLTHSFSHTLFHTLSLTHSFTITRSLTQSVFHTSSLSLTHSLFSSSLSLPPSFLLSITLSLSLSHCPSLSLQLTLTHLLTITLSLSLTLFHTLSFTHSLSLTQAHPHSFTYRLTLSLSLSEFFELARILILNGGLSFASVFLPANNFSLSNCGFATLFVSFICISAHLKYIRTSVSPFILWSDFPLAIFFSWRSVYPFSPSLFSLAFRFICFVVVEWMSFYERWVLSQWNYLFPTKPVGEVKNTFFLRQIRQLLLTGWFTNLATRAVGIAEEVKNQVCIPILYFISRSIGAAFVVFVFDHF